MTTSRLPIASLLALVLSFGLLSSDADGMNITQMPSNPYTPTYEQLPFAAEAPVSPETIVPLNRALVSITFDDGWMSVYQNAVPILTKLHYPSVFYINTGVIGQPTRFTQAIIKELHNAGHEIAAHTISHAHLNTLTAEEVEKELTVSKKTLETITGAPVPDFAAPFGEASKEVIDIIKKYFQSNRSVRTGYNSRSHFFPYEMKVQNITVNVTPATVDSWLDFVVKEKVWLILVYHQVDGGKALYSTTAVDFGKHMAAIKRRNLPVVTIEQGLKEVLPQLVK